MRDSLSTFKIWAPDSSPWSDWAKPSLFAQLPSANLVQKLDIPPVRFVTAAQQRTAIVVDLPGEHGVYEGLGLAKLGYRPVPLYNGVSGTSPLVSVQGVVATLFSGAEDLLSLTLRDDAPPAFLLDANRMSAAGKQKGRFDNRWCVFPQDMPSAAFLRQKGITEVILRATEVRADLSHVLLRYQEAGIRITQCRDGLSVQAIEVKKPTRFKSSLYRYSVIMGLTRNAAGGFGGWVPEPTQSSGVRYYGVG